MKIKLFTFADIESRTGLFPLPDGFQPAYRRVQGKCSGVPGRGQPGGFWKGLEEVRGLCASAVEWQNVFGDPEMFAAVRENFLRPRPDLPVSISAESGDVAMLELNVSRLGRAIARGFGCDAKETVLGIPGTLQIGSFTGAAMPVVLTIQHDRASFRSAVGQIAARLREHFVILSPTGVFHDAHTQGMLKPARAGFFDLESHLTLLPSGSFTSRRTAGELFSAHLPEQAEPASDTEARSLFALIKQLESTDKSRKAPIMRVFRLYCMEALTQAEVARRCKCAESLITLRLGQIKKHLGRHPAELRQHSSHFDRIEASLSDPRARRIYRRSTMDEDAFDE